MDPKPDKFFQVLEAKGSHLKVVLVEMVLKKSLNLGVGVRYK